MENKVKVELRMLKIIHAALMISVITFLTISIILNKLMGKIVLIDTTTQLTIILMLSNLMAFSSVFTGIVVFKKRIRNLDVDVLIKIQKYKEAMIIRSAAIESASFIFIVLFIITGSQILLAEAFLGLALMIVFFPTNSRIASEINYDIRSL